MAEYISDNSSFESKIKYLGYKGVNQERISVKNANGLLKLLPVIKGPNYQDLEGQLDELEEMSLEDVRSLAKNFLTQHFDLHNVSFVETSELQKHSEDIQTSYTAAEAYGKVNSLLKDVNPLDLPIKLVENHAMYGLIKKPLLYIPTCLDEPTRKTYFEYIELGKQLNALSVGTYVHEIAHSQQESNIGYADDYLNKEFISIFLEKVAALELDETRKLLQLSERVRFSDFYFRFSQLYKANQANIKPNVDDLLYYKSILYATKLFDSYCKEMKQKNKDGYMEDIQSVFDGKSKVEDIIKKRGITINKALDLSLIGKHI